MKKIYVNEEWCLGCHLCEYYCAFANSGSDDIAKALKDSEIKPRIRVEGDNEKSFAVSCRHCEDPLCVKGCITGALSVEDGIITVDAEKCVGCYTCVMLCPYGAVIPSDNESAVYKCELCIKNGGEPACAAGCPNKAIVFEER